MKNAGNIFVGILAAATAGVVIGMLIAPEKGQDLRKNIRGSAGDLSKKFGDLMDEGKDQLASMKSMFDDSLHELQKEGKHFTDQVGDTFKNGRS